MLAVNQVQNYGIIEGTKTASRCANIQAPSIERYASMSPSVSHSTCIDCGKPVSTDFVKRCAACEKARRKKQANAPTKKCPHCSTELPNTKDFFYTAGKREGEVCLNGYCKTCCRAIGREKSKTPESRKKARELYAKNPEHHRDVKRKERDKNRDAINARNRANRAINPTKNRLRNHIRRTAEHNLLHDFTAQDWEYALKYFHNRCAVCEQQLMDLFGERMVSMDHWIPVTSSDCPGTIPSNMIPLCMGKGGCNNSKNNTAPAKWLISRFGKRKANKIEQRINQFFETVRKISS